MNFAVLLTVLFIGLKLTGFITWSWLAVLSPLIVFWIIWWIIVILAAMMQ